MAISTASPERRALAASGTSSQPSLPNTMLLGQATGLCCIQDILFTTDIPPTIHLHYLSITGDTEGLSNRSSLVFSRESEFDGTI